MLKDCVKDNICALARQIYWHRKQSTYPALQGLALPALSATFCYRRQPGGLSRCLEPSPTQETLHLDHTRVNNFATSPRVLGEQKNLKGQAEIGERSRQYVTHGHQKIQSEGEKQNPKQISSTSTSSFLKANSILHRDIQKQAVGRTDSYMGCSQMSIAFINTIQLFFFLWKKEMSLEWYILSYRYHVKNL